MIQKTAALVGDRHKVDLEHPDLVILVEVYKVRLIHSRISILLELTRADYMHNGRGRW